MKSFNYRGYYGIAWKDECRLENKAQGIEITASQRRGIWVWLLKRHGKTIDCGEHRLRYKALDEAIKAIKDIT